MFSVLKIDCIKSDFGSSYYRIEFLVQRLDRVFSSTWCTPPAPQQARVWSRLEIASKFLAASNIYSFIARWFWYNLHADRREKRSDASNQEPPSRQWVSHGSARSRRITGSSNATLIERPGGSLGGKSDDWSMFDKKDNSLYTDVSNSAHLIDAHRDLCGPVTDV